MGRLTTHVLDTTRGLPAAGLFIELFELTAERRLLVGTRTNADGRCEGPLLSAEQFRVGEFEMLFHAGDYLRAHHQLTEPLFLDRIPIRFSITDRAAHYHVPLLLSPFAYSTYRGS